MTAFDAKQITLQAKALFAEEKSKKRLEGWFLSREIVANHAQELKALPKELRAAHELRAILAELPLSISEHAIFAGSQSDAFARSYALINPAFTVDSFSGYCDPTATFGDIEPNETITAERIERVREYTKNTDYVRELSKVYREHENDTSEVVYFFEQVTGHIIPDFRAALREGLNALISRLENKLEAETDPHKRINYEAMKITLESTISLAARYAALAEDMMRSSAGARAVQLERMAAALRRVPAGGCGDLFDAIQAFMLLWQVMCLEQAPNPFAFSVGNADRIFEPYRKMERLARADAAALLRHLLVFFNVGDRSWAISQNLMVGGKDAQGRDLTNETSYALMDAYFEMNLPQPILSAKLHRNTPDEFYEAMGKFFFSPGVLTPSLFNDDTVFPLLRKNGVEEDDLPDYSVAGCQEPLIMGKDNGNTTNSWLNLGKILELTLTGGESLLTGKQLDRLPREDVLKDVRSHFYHNARKYIERMTVAANRASEALGNLPVPFLSAFMGGADTGWDMRDTGHQGTRYNGSGCLIHGLSVVADSFCAIDKLLSERPQDAERLVPALRADFAGYEDLHEFLKSAPKFGNNDSAVDGEAREIAEKISALVHGQKNYLDNPFRPDWSTPTTHLLYGFWVGATPDGRKAREQLGYGVDPLYGDANQGMGARALSCMRLPFLSMCGGYASHFGIDPKYFTASTPEGKGLDFARRIIKPLFFNDKNTAEAAPFYLYVNVTTPETLRKVLADPQTYAPSGIYIMRIHGTFVNFLDLSPDIQQDIIKRLDPLSTAIGA